MCYANRTKPNVRCDSWAYRTTRQEGDLGLALTFQGRKGQGSKVNMYAE